MKLNSAYWSSRYKNEDAGWDIGSISTPLKEYIDQLKDPSQKILIPGCGNGYEGEYLWDKGFKNITLLDYSEEPIKNIKTRRPDLPETIFIEKDFFTYTGSFDLILEQTLFCALDPKLRKSYVEKMHALLQPGGKLVGVFFNRTFDEGPPFGGSQEEYLEYFSAFFTHISISPCKNSIPQRAGSEIFVILKKDS